MWSTIWTGGYPNLCSGEWKLFKDGIEVKTDIPFQNEPANTYGTYQEWLKTIAQENEWEYIYEAFKENDWRHSSCGGCI